VLQLARHRASWLLSPSWEFKDKIAMLHLAQVQNNEVSGAVEVRSLARQQSEDLWILTPSEEVLPVDSDASLHPGLLVLVELSENQEVISICDAKDWAINIIRQYLSRGITPDFLQQEIERAEQWRQELTLQSQELARKTLEKESHREQLQVLEEELQRQKLELELKAEKLRAWEEELKSK